MASFQYKKVLLLGSTSGIGAALADKLVENDVFVIGVGRREERLKEFVSKHGQQKTDHRVFDINDLDAIPQFVSDIFTAHPDIDFVSINPGIQRALDFTQASNVDLSKFDLELKTNYTAPVHLTKAILPYLTSSSQQKKTAIAYTTTQLALITLNSRPNYGASKAALHHFILALRAQLSQSPTNPNTPKIIEIFPPAVQTELHDSKHQPDLKNGHQIGMPLQEFTEQLWEGLVNGGEDVAVGTAKDAWEAVEPGRRKESKKFNDAMDQALKDFLA